MSADADKNKNRRMSYTLDFATTARQPFTEDYASAPPCLATDDTADFVRAVHGDLTGEVIAQDQVHPYAEGVIRFYRARTILTRDSGQQRYGRAWFYLARLRPHDLPPAARRPFFELVYFMQEQTHRELFHSVEFRWRILKIAEEIDRFMEDFDRR